MNGAFGVQVPGIDIFQMTYDISYEWYAADMKGCAL